MALLPQDDSLLFLGTGTSEGVPRVSCLTAAGAGDAARGGCAECCARAASATPRRNTSLLVRTMEAGAARHVLIDCGKRFWEGAMHWFPRAGVRELHAVVITHAHADAINGLDDLRDWTQNVSPGVPLPVFLRAEDLDVVRAAFPYLVDSAAATGGGQVPALDFRVIAPGTVFQPVPGLAFTPFTVHHGFTKDAAGERIEYRSLGFRWARTVYISDCHSVPQDEWATYVDDGEPLQVLVLDSLRPSKPHTSHWSLDQAMDAVEGLKAKPERVFVVGMNHEMRAEVENARIADRIGTHMVLAEDGMVVRNVDVVA